MQNRVYSTFDVPGKFEELKRCINSSDNIQPSARGFVYIDPHDFVNYNLNITKTRMKNSEYIIVEALCEDNPCKFSLNLDSLLCSLGLQEINL